MVALTVDHATSAELAAGVVVLFAGIGATWAALANLIVETVPLEQTSEATGFNGLCRIVGSALGAQVAVTIASAASPARDQIVVAGLTAAFGVFTIVMLVSVGLALVLPRPALAV